MTEGFVLMNSSIIHFNPAIGDWRRPKCTDYWFSCVRSLQRRHRWYAARRSLKNIRLLEPNPSSTSRKAPACFVHGL